MKPSDDDALAQHFGTVSAAADSVGSAACNLCGSESFQNVWTIESCLRSSPKHILRFPAVYHVGRCKSCGLLQVRERAILRSEFLRELYSREYFESYGGGAYGRHSRMRPFRKYARILDKHCPRMDGKLLEIGCAHGDFLEECTMLGWDVSGVEPSSHAAEVARSRGLNVRCGSLSSADFGGTEYDAVVTLATIEHVTDPKHFLQTAASLLKAGGHLMLTTVDLEGLVPRLRGSRWSQIAPPWHLYYFSQSHMVRYLEEVGLRVLYIGGKVCPGVYRANAYRRGRRVWNLGYMLVIATK